MLLRLTTFLVSQVLGAALGGWRAGAWGALAGACVGTWLWLAWDAWRGARVLAWLRQGDAAAAPRLRGLWGEVADRARRLLRQGQQREAASQAQLRGILAALQASPNGVTLLDAQGRIEWCNRIAQEHFGLDAERDALQSIGNLVRDPAFSAYCAARDFSHDVVLPGRHSTDSHPVRVSAQLHPYGEGRLLLLSRDITALEQAEAMRRDFVANVSHEIRTPLTVLMGFVETLQTLPLPDDERQRYLGLMAQQATRMHHLVQDLLTLSRLEGSPLPDMHEWTDVALLLARCEQEARALSHALNEGAGRAAQRIVFPAAEVLRSAGQVAGSPQELHSALANLVNNAVRYPPAGASRCSGSPWWAAARAWSWLTAGRASPPSTCRASPSAFTAWTAAARATPAAPAWAWPSSSTCCSATARSCRSAACWGAARCLRSSSRRAACVPGRASRRAEAA